MILVIELILIVIIFGFGVWRQNEICKKTAPNLSVGRFLMTTFGFPFFAFWGRSYLQKEYMPLRFSLPLVFGYVIWFGYILIGCYEHFNNEYFSVDIFKTNVLRLWIIIYIVAYKSFFGHFFLALAAISVIYSWVHQGIPELWSMFKIVFDWAFAVLPGGFENAYRIIMLVIVFAFVAYDEIIRLSEHI